ncbi:DNL-type zinc finger protein [Smittium mucronatum]|uniref:DNL-type zinc finger protein n=1 Tax=Smittium mucronatum TaxID=133383 RepID=A0A1R0H7W3_9FUNG|nr:DNL-type zinc finger protein [Smittium mucronatum]
MLKSKFRRIGETIPRTFLNSKLGSTSTKHGVHNRWISSRCKDRSMWFQSTTNCTKAHLGYKVGAIDLGKFYQKMGYTSSQLDPSIGNISLGEHSGEERDISKTASLKSSVPAKVEEPLKEITESHENCGCSSGTHSKAERESQCGGAVSNNGEAQPNTNSIKMTMNDRFLIGFTCKVCNHRQYKTVSKRAYNDGVVLIKCDGCQNRHLFADNLGWFRDNKMTIEDIMKEQGEVVKKSADEGLFDYFGVDNKDELYKVLQETLEKKRGAVNSV